MATGQAVQQIFFCIPAFIWRLIGAEILNLANPTQNPYFLFGDFFFQNFKESVIEYSSNKRSVSHFGQISAKKKVARSSPSGRWSDPALVTAPVPFGMNQCSSQLLNLPQSTFFSPYTTLARRTTPFTHLPRSFCNGKTYISSWLNFSNYILFK